MTKTILTVAVIVAMLGACEGREPASAHGQSGQQIGSLDQLLAPIALYPDQLLAQILLCASDPAKVTQLDKWLKDMKNVKATLLQDAALKAGFEPSYVALVLFPQVVAKMATDIQWTTLLGQAFAADRSAVFASIQKLRHQAQDVGTLKDTPQQEVSTQTTPAGEQMIVIESANPQVVYVPQYNTTTVYTQAPTTTVVVQDSSADQAVAAGLIGFTAGIAIGAAMDNNYYYGPYGMHGGAYMYNDAWDDYYDHREDARDDWQDHREDLNENRSDRAEDARENRSDRAENAQENRGDRSATTQQQRTERQQTRQETAKTTQRTGSTEARGYGDGSKASAAKERSGGSSDAFSGYSSGKSQRAASSRGQQSRSSSRRSGGGGGGRRR